MKDYDEFSIENYQEKENIIKGISANIFSLLISIAIIVLLGFVYYKIWGYFIHQPIFRIDILLFIIIWIGFIFVHEMIHGIFWSKYTEVKINVVLKMIWRFCHCDNVIKIKNYIIGLIMPTIILGIIPALVGIIFGNIFIFTFGLLMIVTGTDDFYTVYLLRKENKEAFMKDICSKIGFIIYTKK